MADAIQRYDLPEHDCNDRGEIDLVKSEDGNLVLHADHLAAVEARVKPLREALLGVDWSEALTYEGNLEASVHLSVDALNAIRAALAAEEAARGL